MLFQPLNREPLNREPEVLPFYLARKGCGRAVDDNTGVGTHTMNLVGGALALGAHRHGHGLLTDGVQTSAGISWKVAVAAYLKETTDVSNPWLAGQLDMGSPVYVSKHVGQLRKTGLSAAGKWLQHLRKVNGKA